MALPRWQVLFALRSRVAKCVALIALLALLSIPLSVWPSYSLSAFLGTCSRRCCFSSWPAPASRIATSPDSASWSWSLSVGADALYVLAGPAPLMAGRPYIGAGLDPNESAALFVFTLPFAIGLGVGRERRRWLGLAVALLLVAAVPLRLAREAGCWASSSSR